MVTDLCDDRTRGLCWGIFDALMMGGSGLVGNGASRRHFLTVSGAAAAAEDLCSALPQHALMAAEGGGGWWVAAAITINFAPQMPTGDGSDSGSGGAGGGNFRSEVREPRPCKGAVAGLNAPGSARRVQVHEYFTILLCPGPLEWLHAPVAVFHPKPSLHGGFLRGRSARRPFTAVSGPGSPRRLGHTAALLPAEPP
jgi:hypothetical protein